MIGYEWFECVAFLSLEVSKARPLLVGRRSIIEAKGVPTGTVSLVVATALYYQLSPCE